MVSHTISLKKMFANYMQQYFLVTILLFLSISVILSSTIQWTRVFGVELEDDYNKLIEILKM